jgi:aquaporin Z
MAVQSATTQMHAADAFTNPSARVTAPRPRPALHWPEYLIEATCLALLMLSICLFGALMEYPDSPVRQLIGDGAVRRIPMGLAVGLTAMALIYSRMGQRSGAHMNPATTLAFLRLGKITRTDAVGYIAAQVIGGVLGVQAAALLIHQALGHPAVNYLTTVSGIDGVAIAFVAEAAMSCVLMLTILAVSNQASIARYTGLCAGLVIALFIIVEAPVSGMSVNPARTLGSALAAGTWSGFWIYVIAPPLGMLLAAQIFSKVVGRHQVKCAKLHHPEAGPCHFKCSTDAADAG